MSDVSDAIAKAREIAARLSGLAAGGGSDLGKRKNRWGDDDGTASGAGLGLIKKKKVYIPVKEHPDINFLGLLIGPRGQTQKQLQESTGAKILFKGRGAQKDGFPAAGPDDDDELHVSIEGTEEAVEAATREVQQILFNPEQAMRLKQQQLQSLAELNSGSADGASIYGPGGDGNYSIELRVPNNMVGLVIGKGGENIHKIQSATGAHMQIAKESDMKPGDTMRSITVKGTPAAVAELKKRVDEIIMQRLGPSTGAKAPGSELYNPVVVKVIVPNDKVGCIIGKLGMTVKGIQERCHVHIQIPPGADEDNPQVRTLSIGSDTKEQADAAQLEIFQILAMQQQQQQATSAAAQAMSANTMYVVIPDDKIGLVIGKGGMTIKDLQNRYQVRIQIPHCADPGTIVRTCSIVGTPQAQHVARHEIEQLLRTPIQAVSALPPGVVLPPISGGALPTQQMGMGGYGMQGYGSGYGATAATASYYGATAATYGGYDASAYYQQQMQYQQQQQQAATTTEVPTDPTAYYNDFWAYAAYYGEPAARQYYGAWSPPEGSVPPATATPAADASATATYDAASSSAAPAEASQQQAAPATAPSGEEAGAGAATTAASSDPSAAQEVDASDPAAVAAAWEAYRKQYSEWYEAYGKEQGADPNPPQMF